jgi:hypothetical protein
MTHQTIGADTVTPPHTVPDIGLDALQLRSANPDRRQFNDKRSNGMPSARGSQNPRPCRHERLNDSRRRVNVFVPHADSKNARR